MFIPRFRILTPIFSVAALGLILPVRSMAGPDFAEVRTKESARIELVRKLTPSAVCIFGKESRAGGGSGMVIDAEGYGLTNFHVVAGMMPDRAGDGGLFDGKLYDLEVLGIDPTGDVAMFKLDTDAPFAPAALGNSDELSVGQETLALGNPFLLAEDYTPTVTFGIISGLHRYQYGSGRALIYTDCIQVDTSINPGNSGGPLFDLGGHIIGINGRVSIEERGRVNVGVGYAISINQIKRFIPALRAGLVVKHGAAGFTVFDRRNHAVIDKILEDSHAYAAGLRLEDQILRFDGREVATANQFLSILGTYPADWPVEVVYQRGGNLAKAKFRLDEVKLPKPSFGRLPPGVKPPDPYAENEKTIAANRRAVDRLLKLAVEAVGGAEAISQVKSVRFQGKRTDPADPVAEPRIIDLTEKLPREDNAAASQPAPDVEEWLRWRIWSKSVNARDYRVIGSEPVGGKIAAVLEQRADDIGYRIMIDDEDGRLLAIEIIVAMPPGPGSRIEYDAYQRCGALRLPFEKKIYSDGKLSAEEKYSDVSVSGK
jgi:S1-C subfamily serine protease